MPGRQSARGLIALGALLGLASSVASAQDSQRATARERELLLGPRLLYYPVECKNPRGCRIECFQNGTSVMTLSAISAQDEVRLVLSSGVPEDLTPRWLEHRPFNEQNVQTYLLSPDTFCHFESLRIVPKHTP